MIWSCLQATRFFWNTVVVPMSSSAKTLDQDDRQEFPVKYALHIPSPPRVVYDRDHVPHVACPQSHPEHPYLALLRNVLVHGEPRSDRTGTGTIALFAPNPLKFELYPHFPLLTSKRVPFNAVMEELAWFLHADTNVASLQAKGVKIWDGNATREYFDRIGLVDRKEGDLGPIYGWQWRYFGGKYENCETNYLENGAGEGSVDQIKQLVDGIRKNPMGRRHILSAWNPKGTPIFQDLIISFI